MYQYFNPQQIIQTRRTTPRHLQSNIKKWVRDPLCWYIGNISIQNRIIYKTSKTYPTNSAKNDRRYSSRYATKLTNPTSLRTKLLKNHRYLPIRNQNKIRPNYKINPNPHPIRYNKSVKYHSKTCSKLKPILTNRTQGHRNQPRPGRSNSHDIILTWG